MPQLTITVAGQRPVPWACNEWVWRAAVAQVTRTVDSAPVSVPASTSFSITLIFRMQPARMQRTDLDNLAKPVLDTLFHAKRPQVRDPALTGALFDCDDDRVYQLTLEKRAVSSAPEEGVDISISW
jgi:Holliday junction resolvase RusA-like endonuclease